MGRADDGDLRPDQVRTTAEFLSLLRKLKHRSGYSYRELERRAARHGDVLPRSTIADAMRRDSLPPTDRLVALVRACGGEEQMPQWVRTRDRLADAGNDDPAGPGPVVQDWAGPGPVVQDWAGPGPVVEDSVGPGPVVQDSVGPGSAGHDPVGSRPATGEAGPGGHRADGGARRGPAARPARAGQPGRAAARLWPTAGERSAPVLLALLVGALVVAGGWALLPGTPPTGAPSGAAATTTPSRTAGQDHPLPANLLGQVRIRPVTAPTLCLTDGRVLDRRYTPLVAVQRPCDEVSPQTTTIQPTGEGTYRIRWDHPDYGPGCLVVLTDGPGIGLLEPWDDCVRASHFRIEPSGSYDGGTYVLRVVGNGCAGIRQSSTEAGTEVVMERCVGRGGQVFVIEPAFRSGPT